MLVVFVRPGGNADDEFCADPWRASAPVAADTYHPVLFVPRAEPELFAADRFYLTAAWCIPDHGGSPRRPVAARGAPSALQAKQPGAGSSGCALRCTGRTGWKIFGQRVGLPAAKACLDSWGPLARARARCCVEGNRGACFKRKRQNPQQ